VLLFQIAYFERAAARGVGEALYNLGVFRLNGEAGFARDPVKRDLNRALPVSQYFIQDISLR